MNEELSADYVIVGSGAIGMAFADVLIEESDATLIITDIYATPGGYWNVAYPFVQLHQPAAYYGVSSKALGAGIIEQGGLNAGLEELSIGAEVSTYFYLVVRHQFLPTGRVKYFPVCDYLGRGKIMSKVNGKEYQAEAKIRTVDATLLNTSVPSTHSPNFDVVEGVRFIPLNDLPNLTKAQDNYMVIGDSKTGIDACLWLLEQKVDSDIITWVVSREARVLNRKNTQMSGRFLFDRIDTQASMYANISASASPKDIFERLERCGCFIRIHKEVTPEIFHAATVSELEVEQRRHKKNVVRMGHAKAIANTIHVDRSARALVDEGGKPVFQGDMISPKMIRPYQPVFCAALIAYIELNFHKEEEKNRLCGLVLLPNAATDFIFFTAAVLVKQYHWLQEKKLKAWMLANRLDGASTLVASIGSEENEELDVVSRVKASIPLAAGKVLEFQKGLTLSREWV